MKADRTGVASYLAENAVKL